MFQQHDPKQQLRIRRFRSSTAWTKLSKWKLDNNPLCFDPFKDHYKEGRVVLSKEVHHIKQVATNWELRASRDNLASLCTACHSRVSRIERLGGDSIGLFPVNM